MPKTLLRDETLRIMAGIETRLNSYIDKQVCTCGHQELEDEAFRYRVRLERFIEKNIEALCEKAGLP